MKPKTLLISLCIAGAAAATAAAIQNPPTRPPDGDAQKAVVFQKLTNGPAGGESNPCVRQTWAERTSANREADADFVHTLALCVNIADPDDQWECVLEAFDELDEVLEEIQDQFFARLDLCTVLGGDTYEPEIDPDYFVEVIDNPFFPLTPGTTLVYEKETDEGTETVHVTTTDETREILEVECTVVRDTEWLDGEIQEDTFDYYAQDVDGNVWYFGELSFEYEDGEIAALEGSWIAGEDGAHPGILMQADPMVGQIYRQEFLLGEAEDVGEVLALNESVEVPYGSFEGCLKTLDSTPLEPGSEEEKFYAPGVGPVLEVDLENGEMLELVDIIVE